MVNKNRTEVEKRRNGMMSWIDTHAVAKNTFGEDFFVRKCLAIIIPKGSSICLQFFADLL